MAYAARFLIPIFNLRKKKVIHSLILKKLRGSRSGQTCTRFLSDGFFCSFDTSDAFSNAVDSERYPEVSRLTALTDRWSNPCMWLHLGWGLRTGVR